MKLEKKIFLDRSDGLDIAVDAVIGASAVRVILNIPKRSVLGESMHNFQVLKRESETAEKELTVESIDEHILELASVAKIPALNPIFKTRERAVTDIIPRTSFKLPEGTDKEIVRREPDEVEEESEVRPKPKKRLWQRGREEKKKEERPVVLHEEAERKRPTREKRGRRFVVSFASFVALLVVGFVLVVYILPRVTIQMSLKKTEANFNAAVTVLTSAATAVVNQNALTLPGQLLTAKKNLVMSFKAEGTTEQVDGYAEGTLTVFNGYSKTAQAFVKNTGFESPDGKIFRGLNAFTVPGAKTVNGELQPSSIDIKVRAEKPGDAYNISLSSDLWMIPKLKAPLYGKFYATMKEPMSGGFSGTKVVPQEDDITNAKAKVAQPLRNALETQMALSGSENFKLLSEAVRFEVTNQTVVNSTSSDGTFAVFSEGTLSELVFDEGMLKQALMELAGISNGEDMQINGFILEYTTTTANFSDGKLVFSVSGSFSIQQKIDLDRLRSQVAGQNENDLKATLFSIPGLERANISFWPFWVTQVPESAGKIDFVVQ